MSGGDTAEPAAMTDRGPAPMPAHSGEADHHRARLLRLIARLPGPLQRATHWLLRPSSRLARIPAGVLLVIGGVLSILPVLGLWMLPLGLVLLAEDVAPLRRRRDRMLEWLERRRPHWFHGND
jgi:hypothetical protein